MIGTGDPRGSGELLSASGGESLFARYIDSTSSYKLIHERLIPDRLGPSDQIKVLEASGRRSLFAPRASHGFEVLFR